MLASTVINVLDDLFASYGLPSYLVTDNQSTFVSAVIQEFLQKRGIKHRTIAPYHCATNGLAERMVSAMKLCLRTLNLNEGNAPEKLRTFLAAYRRAPHPTTGVSPAMAFLKRKVNTPLSLLTNPSVSPTIEKRAQLSYEYHDPVFPEGSKVAVKDGPLRKWKLGYVISRDGELSYTVMVDGELNRKHVDQLKKVGQDVPMTLAVTPSITPAIPVPVATPAASGPAQSPPDQPEQSTPVRTGIAETPRAPVSDRPPPSFAAQSTPPRSAREKRIRRPVIRYSP
ncbi:uncharacterized protein K02A2.6-like [Photinus pyralis]|uniref:uncharacterized protein K02A2.6-like n=1 Tax=Photinus pyralis TaxID=7054 RepID=UPI0012672D0E|nr:uncharacterized protein K02A2.6-like [Photinus pyralis]